MSDRRGEKIGWIGGWLGGFVWVLILAVILLVQGRMVAGMVGLALAIGAVAAILVLSPWKHPETKYWKLLAPIYAVFAGSIGWALWSAQDLGGLGLSWWSLFLLLPVLSPFLTIGQKRWREGAPH